MAFANRACRRRYPLEMGRGVSVSNKLLLHTKMMLYALVNILCNDSDSSNLSHMVGEFH